MSIECGEIMTQDLVFFEVNTPIGTVAKRMANRGDDVILIVESKDNMKLAGILTNNDIVAKAVAADKSPKTTLINEIMSSTPVACHPQDDINEALKTMDKNHLQLLPVVDSENRLLGAVTVAEIIARQEQLAQVAPITHVDLKPYDIAPGGTSSCF